MREFTAAGAVDPPLILQDRSAAALTVKVLTVTLRVVPLLTKNEKVECLLDLVRREVVLPSGIYQSEAQLFVGCCRRGQVAAIPIGRKGKFPICPNSDILTIGSSASHDRSSLNVKGQGSWINFKTTSTQGQSGWLLIIIGA